VESLKNGLGSGLCAVPDRTQFPAFVKAKREILTLPIASISECQIGIAPDPEDK
jgi:hypothetical protein